MKILVLGATGATGQLIVRDATASGHYVVALVRAKARADLPGAELIEGDVRDEGTLARALNGCDAVVSALGTGMGLRPAPAIPATMRLKWDSRRSPGSPSPRSPSTATRTA